MGIRRKADMAIAPQAEPPTDVLNMMSTPSRIRTAYLSARSREGAPAGHLDWTYQRFNHDLAVWRNADHLNGPQQMGRDTQIARLLKETEATFVKWREMPSDELVRETSRMIGVAFATVAPSPAEQVKMATGQAEAAGVNFEHAGHLPGISGGEARSEAP